MNIQSLEANPGFDTNELVNFKSLTDQLMCNLQNGDFESALRYINAINQINDDKLYSIIGKITRGLHNAIADLQLSSTETKADKNRTKTGLGYVIDVTADAAKTTLDMTEKSRDALLQINENLAQQNLLLEQLKHEVQGNTALKSTVSALSLLLANNKQTIDEINGNVMEIIIAQNFQDLASQSIMKSITNIRGVESSLIALTKHTNLLKQISHFTANPEKLDPDQKEELCQSLEKLDLSAENEHMNQDDVDNLLSSLGF